jgi:hypothetical protein
MFPSLSNSSKIRSHLETSKVKFSYSCRPLVAGLSDAQELALAIAGHTNSLHSSRLYYRNQIQSYEH